MNGLANSITGPATIYSQAEYAGMQSLFNPNICKPTSDIAEKIIEAKGLMATSLRNHLAHRLAKLPDSINFSGEVKTNRYAHELLTLYYSAKGINPVFQNYGTTQPGFLSSAIHWITRPVTGTFSWLKSWFFTPTIPMNCDESLHNLNQEEFTICQAFTRFTAEKHLDLIKTNCSDILNPEINLFSKSLTQNFTAYWAAANDKTIDLSFSATEARTFWTNSLKPSFCAQQTDDNPFCSDQNLQQPASFQDWKNRFFDLVKGRLPVSMEAELVSESTITSSPNIEL